MQIGMRKLCRYFQRDLLGMPGDSLTFKMEGVSLVQLRESEPRKPADRLGRLIFAGLWRLDGMTQDSF